MVAAKTKKVIKYTYTERVLGSFSLIQREHKKHAIHLASLRAQILKTANARKDKLGPHWKNWVGKAVHRLEEDGILSFEPAGTVALTSNGKKAILAARRALALPAHDSLSSDQEDLLWKEVTHPNSVQAIASPVKRTRHTRHTEHLSDEEDSEPEYVPRKRTRTSVPARAGKITDPAFKMTKAQLVAELAKVKRAQEADRLRAASPLTELEDDESEEVTRLKEILKHKNEEILRLQLSNRNSAPDPFDTDMEISSPLRPNFEALNRTQSARCRPVPPFINPLATPDATPAKTQPKNQMTKISFLEHALQLRSTELQNLVRKLSEVEAQHAQAEKSLSNKNSHISILQTNLALFETQISERDAAISRIPDLECVKADLEASIAEKVAQVQCLIHERDAAIVNLNTEKNEHDHELSRMRLELNLEVETGNARLASLESKITKLRSELDSERVSAVDLFGERARLEEELSAQRELVVTADGSNQLLVKRIAELDQRVEEQSAVELSLKEEIVRAEKALFATTNKLSDVETKRATLVEELTETTDKLASARQSLADARAAAEALKPQMAALDDALTKRISSQREVQERLTKTQRDADTFRLKVGILETTTSNLRANLESKTIEAEQLAQNLVERTEANAVLISSLEKKERQLTDVNISKDELQNTFDETTSGLRDQLALLDAAKTSLTAELAATSATAEETVVKLREAEARQETLRIEITAKDHGIQQLRVQLGDSVGRVGELEQNLDAVGARYASDIAERKSTNTALDNSLSDVRRITDALDAEKQRGKLVAAECEDANSRVQEVEQELLELQVSKDADAATIEGLKDIFSQLKATQMQSLAEMNNKLESAQSTPVPKRRTSKIPIPRSA
ncbi:hypothetical protein K438DRAFT_1854724 [Mycena galopus ATCC 62051]|nr:hypothetical protein K438DRAFT_1854724 [Mycena galopus ATCC 62051]